MEVFSLTVLSNNCRVRVVMRHCFKNQHLLVSNCMYVNPLWASITLTCARCQSWPVYYDCLGNSPAIPLEQPGTEQMAFYPSIETRFNRPWLATSELESISFIKTRYLSTARGFSRRHPI